MAYICAKQAQESTMTTPTLPKKRYIARDISWMHFNARLIAEAERTDIPLLERLHYLGIYSNNLDEFYRVRVATLRRTSQGIGAEQSPSEMQDARNTLRQVARLNLELVQRFETTLASLIAELATEGIHLVGEQELSPEQELEVFRYYTTELASLINPLLINGTDSFPDLSLRDGLYLLVMMYDEGGQVGEMAVLEIPSGGERRFLELERRGQERYLMFVDDVLRLSLPSIFATRPWARYEAFTFKITKDAELNVQSDLRRSLADKVWQGVKQRRRGDAIRLIYDSAMPAQGVNCLRRITEMGSTDNAISGGRYHNMRDLMKLPNLGRADLRWAPQPPIQTSPWQYSSSIIEEVMRGDIGLHTPYESFDRFLGLLREAALSPIVHEIRITIYRLAKDSKVINSLITAAQNGKRVTAVIELLARFDEANNVSWSKKLQDAGVQVIIGHEKLKVHSKLVHLVTTRGEVTCIGSGNMHEGTACLYTDYMLMTAHRGICADVRRVFDFISEPFRPITLQHLLVSPNHMRTKLYQLINREIRIARSGGEAYIKLKINHIVDERMVAKLYEAAEAGVRIEISVRTSCSLVPDTLPAGATPMHINAIIDRYLEHARIYIFGAGGTPEYYIGSMDWMERNLDRRIEVMTPVYDPEIQEELEMIVRYALEDTAQGYWVNQRGGAPRRQGHEGELFRSQEALYRYYQNKVR